MKITVLESLFNKVFSCEYCKNFNSLEARDGFIQPIFYKRFDRLQFLNQIKWIKKAVVSCDVTGVITLGTKLKMPVFTL